jgi:UTP--glucose-1-phosphate uridylyltransferase
VTVKKAIIPAAGFATRSLPATKAVPKEMLPLVDKPMIQYAVEEAVASGMKKVGIVTAAWKTAIERHFGPSPELEAFLRSKGKRDLLDDLKRVERLAEFSFILQPEPRGLGHAIAMGEEFAGGKPVAVLNPDTIYDGRVPCLRQLLEVFERKRATTVVLRKVGREGTKKYGVVKADKVSGRVYRISDLVEKPGPDKAPSDLAVRGRYVFTPGIFDALRQTPPGYGGEIQVTDAIRTLLEEEPVYGVLFEGRCFDAGETRGYLQATIHFARKRGWNG